MANSQTDRDLVGLVERETERVGKRKRQGTSQMQAEETEDEYAMMKKIPLCGKF